MPAPAARAAGCAFDEEFSAQEIWRRNPEFLSRSAVYRMISDFQQTMDWRRILPNFVLRTSDWLARTPSTCQGVASIPPSETSFPRVRRLQLQLPFFGGEGDGVRRRVGTRAKNLQLELQRQRPADSDAFDPKHLSLSPAMAVGVISAAAVQSLCSLTASVLHDEKIRLHALVHSQARQTDSPDLLCTLRLG